MTFEVRLAEELDFQKIRPKAIFDSEGVDLVRMADRAPAWTFVNGCTLLVIGGVSVHHAGVGTIWALTSDDMAGCGLALTKQLKRFIEDGARVMKLHRLSMTVKADYDQGLRWARLLGFTPEGILRQYGMDKTDYVQMVRLF